MKKLLTRGLLGIAALAVPGGALMAQPMAANAAPATHVTDATAAVGAAAQFPQYPDGSKFFFYDGNRNMITFTDYQYKDVVTSSGNETEVFIGNTPVANDTGSVVTYNSANNPAGPGMTALSFVSGKQTTNWTMTIQPDGQWNLTANFHKS